MAKYQFLEFELSEEDFTLRRKGQRIALEPKALRVLMQLVSRAGRLVDKQELLESVWPNTFVEENTLTRTIGILRRELGDSSRDSKIIETVPTRGYRFIAPVEVPQKPTSGSQQNTQARPIGDSKVSVGPGAEPSTEPVITVEPDRGSNFRKLRWRVAAGVLTVAIIAVVGVVVYRYRQQHPQEQAAVTPIPFTALPGQATAPAFSPDGSRIAFAWDGDPKGAGKGFDLYVKTIGSETLLRLTQHPSEWISPAWSPDGTQIAFQRLAGADSGIYVVPALGGPERKLRRTRVPWENYLTISWSPDGKWIAFSDWLPANTHTVIYLLSPETGESEPIPNGAKCLTQVQPAFSHRGEYLAYWCSRNGAAFLYSLPIRGGEPRMVSMFRDWPSGLTWSADDKELIFSLWHGFSSGRFGKVTVANGSIKPLGFAVNPELPTISPRGDKLGYGSLSSRIRTNIWRKDLLHPDAAAVAFIPSSQEQFDAEYSPDGNHIVFASMRSGVQGVWISNEDGSDLVQISNPTQASGSPQWSPDGKKIGFDSLSRDGWGIYVADVAERVPRRLVTNISNAVRPHWSRDGKWIYFSSEEPGRTGIYRCPASGGEAVALSKDLDAISPRESFDGKTIYFASRQKNSTLEEVALPGKPGTESEVDGLPRLKWSSLWALSRDGIYFVPDDAPRSLRYFDFASKQIRPIFQVDKDFSNGLSVSPNGRWILYSLVGDESSDIMIVDHFR